MNTKALIWMIFGVILILGGLILSVQEGREIESRGPRPVVARDPAASSILVQKQPIRPESAVPVETHAPTKNFDTGFVIDPVRGLKRKDENENANYFK